MKLPNAEDAVVPEAKIAHYLLSPTHRDGRHKAAFFLRFGFSAEAWPVLASVVWFVANGAETATLATAYPLDT